VQAASISKRFAPMQVCRFAWRLGRWSCRRERACACRYELPSAAGRAEIGLNILTLCMNAAEHYRLRTHLSSRLLLQRDDLVVGHSLEQEFRRVRNDFLALRRLERTGERLERVGDLVVLEQNTEGGGVVALGIGLAWAERARQRAISCCTTPDRSRSTAASSACSADPVP
jgi:hypothetical protein